MKLLKKEYEKYIELCLVSAILAGCSNVQIQKNDTINLENCVENASVIQASDIIDNIQYVALETTDKSLLGGFKKIIPTKDYFFIQDSYMLYIFGRNGQFISRIGNKGQGQEEYVELSDFDIDDHNIYILDDVRSNILVYSYENKFLRSIRLNSYDISNIVKTRDGFIGYQDPLINKKQYGKSAPDLILFDESGKEKSILHYRTINIKSMPPFLHPPVLKKCKDKILYYPPFQDTIFAVAENETKIVPEFILNKGKYAISTDDVGDLESQRKAYERGIVIRHFEINDKWLILYCGSNDVEMYFYNLSTKEITHVSEIVNDIDGILKIFPVCLMENQIAEILPPFELIEANKVPISVKNIKEDDNPVFRISNLK
jgi:hypothetical protein